MTTPSGPLGADFRCLETFAKCWDIVQDVWPSPSAPNRRLYLGSWVRRDASGSTGSSTKGTVEPSSPGILILGGVHGPLTHVRRRRRGAGDPLGSGTHKQHISDPKEFPGLGQSRATVSNHEKSKLQNFLGPQSSRNTSRGWLYAREMGTNHAHICLSGINLTKKDVPCDSRNGALLKGKTGLFCGLKIKY